jgi:tetratricopeptide (TPR) repeat protein
MSSRTVGATNGVSQLPGQAVRLKLGFAKAQFDLGDALFRAGQVLEAMHHYEEAVRISPLYSEAHNYLGNVLASQGWLTEAIAHYEQALRTKPDYVDARRNLEMAPANLAKSNWSPAAANTP